MLAARKISDELNIFEGFFSNWLFLVLWLVIIVGQFIITQFGSFALSVHIHGLTGTQWILSVLFGLTSLICNLFLKLAVQDKWCLQLGDENEADVQASLDDYATLR
jgi:hypothetical protein